MLHSYQKVELLPGSSWPGTYEFHHRKRLLLECGWPDNFDVSGFEHAVAAFFRQEGEDKIAEEPLMTVVRLEAKLKNPRRCSTEQKKKEVTEKLEKAREEADNIPPDVLRRQRERIQQYEHSAHPFYGYSPEFIDDVSEEID